ncbi:MAG: RNA polymerase factor sigma-54 [Candidatus Eisenbacteria bacterium]
MEMKAGLQLRMLQTQRLVMTPQLQQALRLLQMPTLELQQVLKQELLLNPVLEEVDDLVDDAESDDDREETPSKEEKEREKEEKGEGEEEPSKDGESDGEIDWDEYFHNPQEYSYYRRNEGESSDEYYERVPSTTVHLSEHLLGQLRIASEDDEILRIGEFLVGSLDDRGYLTMSLEEVAESVGSPLDRVQEGLDLLQTFDPAGVGARNLRECLLLQLKAKEREGSLAHRIVDEHFDVFVQNKYMELAKKLKTTPGEVQAASAEIGKLNPRPGLLFSEEDPRYIAPDLIVDRVEGEYVVYLNDLNVPRLRVSKAYESILTSGRSKDDDEGTREYIRGKLNAANQLINTIERRRRTMVKVMNAIVENQREFFEKGIRHLRPLTLQQVAEQIGMHESTVSRVTSSKYVQTPRGVFDLKFFFSSSIRSDSGEDVSAKRVKDRVREMVEREDKKKPFSDQKIVEVLKKEGLLIARRTVAKYREQMGILSARYRKEF